MLAVAVVLGFGDNLSEIEPLDRLLNPDARGYLESADDYMEDIFDFCFPRTPVSAFEACYDSSIDSAIERGYLTREEASSVDPQSFSPP